MPGTEIRFCTTEADLAAAFDIREAVFVDEQTVSPALEYDGKDTRAIHVLAEQHGDPIGTARLRGVTPTTAKIERLAVRRPYRQQGVGNRLMQRLERTAMSLNYQWMLLYAQRRVRTFYERRGYQAIGHPFDDADIPHIAMYRSLGKSTVNSHELPALTDALYVHPVASNDR